MAGGNNDQMLNMGLMIAAGIAAPELAPLLMEGGALGAGLGATAATGVTGAVLGGTAGALTGQDVAKSAAMGGLGGAAAGYFGGVQAAEPGSMLAAGPTTSGAGFNTVPTTISPSTVGMDAAGLTQEPTALYSPDQAKDIVNGMQPTRLSGSSPQSITGQPLPSTPTASAASAFDKANIIGGGVAGINSLLTTPTVGAYVPPGSKYTGGNLSKFKYDPATYQPAQVPPPPYGYRQMASGGIASLAMGGQPNQMYPMSQQEHTNFMDPTQLPSSAMQVRNFEPATNPMTGMPTQAMAKGGVTTNSFSDLMNSRDSMDKYMSEYASNPSSVYQKAKDGDYNAMLVLNRINQTPNQNYASGGIAQLAVGGKLLRGNGDGMSDDIRANIDGRQEARLADGEFVIPADVVSHLGNGSTDAGAKQLYSMMDRVREARVGNKKQGKQINPAKYMMA